MRMLSIFPVLQSAGYQLSLSGSTRSEDGPVGPVYYEVSFEGDGYLHYDANGGLSGTFNESTSWILPHERSVGGPFYVKATEFSYNDGTKSGTMGSWIDISTNPAWRITRPNVAGTGSSTWVITFELSVDQSTVLASANISITAEIF